MDNGSMFEVQQQLVRELGLTKVKAVRNEHYHAHGTKSYVSALSRFGFQPTKPGPYTYVNRIKQRGLAGGTVAVGGRVIFERVLVKTASTGQQQGTPGGDTAAPGTSPGDKPSADVTAADQQNQPEYLCEVDIGTPAQKLMLNFDTGSSDLWVFSSELPRELQQGHKVYNAADSSTAQAAGGQAWNIQYGDSSSASGDVVADVVAIGGLKVPQQAVEQATQLWGSFSHGSADGTLGLAWPSINTVTTDGQDDPQPSPVGRAIASGVLPKEAQLFTSALYSGRGPAAASFYTFGYVDRSLVQVSGQDISWAAVDSSKGFWMFGSESAAVGGQQVARPGNTAIADTGSALCLVSDDVCEALYAAIPGARYDDQHQGYVFPASVAADQLPDFAVAVGDKQFAIQKADLAFAPAGDGVCYGSVQSRGQNAFDVLGDVFLQSVYAIWDQGDARFGCVPKLD